MNLILLGPPGAGKGTQAKIIVEKLNIPHISTGDIFRHNISNDTSLGVEAKKYMDRGHLVPDDITNRMVEERLSRDDCKNGFLLDGYPRTINQAKFLEDLFKRNNKNIDLVIKVELKEEEILRRLTNRRVCGNCGAVYHLISNPPAKTGFCNKCGKEICHRADDKEDVILSRIKVYNEQTKPLVEFYTEQKKIFKINGKKDMEVVNKEIMSALEKRKVKS